MRTSLFFILTIFNLLSSTAFSIDPLSYITFQKSKGHFALAETGKVAPLLVSSTDYTGVARALKNLQGDIRQVTVTMQCFLWSPPLNKLSYIRIARPYTDYI